MRVEGTDVGFLDGTLVGTMVGLHEGRNVEGLHDGRYVDGAIVGL